MIVNAFPKEQLQYPGWPVHRTLIFPVPLRFIVSQSTSTAPVEILILYFELRGLCASKQLQHRATSYPTLQTTNRCLRVATAAVQLEFTGDTRVRTKYGHSGQTLSDSGAPHLYPSYLISASMDFCCCGESSLFTPRARLRERKAESISPTIETINTSLLDLVLL